MLIDLRDASAPTELDTDVCIAGAGAAGRLTGLFFAFASRIEPRLT